MASAAPIDQYLMRHPEYFLSRSPECARVDPDNLFILADQLKCAVFELPFGPGEPFGAAPDAPGPAGHEEMLAFLEENGVVRRTGGRWYWADRSYPAEGISLRSAAPGNVVIVDATRGGNRIIGEMDKPSAKELIYDEAVYIHMGDQYIVRKLDLENQRCYVEQTQVNYYTDSIVKTDLKFLQEDGRETGGAGGSAGLELVIGDILVRSQATKYKKLKFHTHENLGYGDIHLPADEMHTRTVVLLFAAGHRGRLLLRGAGGRGAGDRHPEAGHPGAQRGPGVPALRPARPGGQRAAAGPALRLPLPVRLRLLPGGHRAGRGLPARRAFHPAGRPGAGGGLRLRRGVPVLHRTHGRAPDLQSQAGHDPLPRGLGGELKGGA